jgi:hypothetical protein
MPISEERLLKRKQIREDISAAKDGLMVKLREKIQKGFLPKDAKEFADILKLAVDYGKDVGRAEEVKDILETLSEANPQPLPKPLEGAHAMMEKVGVQCMGNHQPTQTYMEKQASGDVKCVHCGQTFGHLTVQDKTGVQDATKMATKQAKSSIADMFGVSEA